MYERLKGSVAGLRRLAADLSITGETKEQTLLLAIIDALDEFARAIESPEPAGLTSGHPDAGVVTSQCPNCGKTISLDITGIRGDGTVICDNCHEIIGVISDSILHYE